MQSANIMHMHMRNQQRCNCRGRAVNFCSSFHRVRLPLHAPCAAGDGGLWGGLQRALRGKQQPDDAASPGPASTSNSSSQPSAASSSSSSAGAGVLLGTASNPLFPPYRVVRKGPKYDLRLYDVYPIVEMDYTRREEGYLTLGQYFDGANADKARLGFTAPVIMRYPPQGSKVMQMYVGGPRVVRPSAASMPAAPSVKDLPAPTDPAVRLSVGGGELVAVAYFEGSITPASAEAARQQLIQALQADGLSLAAAEAGGYFRVGQYGQVYTLDTRINELLLEVVA